MQTCAITKRHKLIRRHMHDVDAALFHFKNTKRSELKQTVWFNHEVVLETALLAHRFSSITVYLLCFSRLARNQHPPCARSPNVAPSCVHNEHFVIRPCILPAAMRKTFVPMLCIANTRLS